MGKQTYNFESQSKQLSLNQKLQLELLYCRYRQHVARLIELHAGARPKELFCSLCNWLHLEDYLGQIGTYASITKLQTNHWSKAQGAAIYWKLTL